MTDKLDKAYNSLALNGADGVSYLLTLIGNFKHAHEIIAELDKDNIHSSIITELKTRELEIDYLLTHGAKEAVDQYS